MKTKITISVLLFILSIISANAQIKPADVDKIIANEMIRQNLPGLAIGVYKKGTINYTKGYGFIDINNRKRINTNTPFRWASISKTITAVAALQVDEKYSDFSINDKVIKHYPYWTSNSYSNQLVPKQLKSVVNNYLNKTKINTVLSVDKVRKEKITIKHLLTHRSGINHYTRGRADKYGEYSNLNKSSYKTDSDNFNANSSVNIFKGAKLDFEPGDKYLYTSYGYNLLGAVIDQKTGSYTNWVTKNIKNKLGLYNLKVANGNMYGFRKPKDGIIKQGKDGSKEFVLPSGGWESNIKDLLKFARGINDGKLLKNTEKLWSGSSKEYNGLESTGKGKELRVWHGGTHGNLKTLMYIMPKKNISVVVMIPVQYANPWNVVRAIVKKLGTPRNPKTSPKDKCGAGMGNSGKKFVGVWRKTNKDVIIRRGYNTKNFNTEWNFLTSKGYHLENIEFSNNLWNGIFKKGRGQYAMWRNFDQAGFNKKWKEMNSKGYRLYDLETYTIGGKRKWAGLFKKGSGKYAMYRNYSTNDFGTKRKSMAKNGYKLIDIEVYNSGGQLKWSGVWIAGKDGLLNRNYSYNDFKNLVRKRAKSGYKLIDVETYKVNGSQKWAGIWEKSSEEQRVSFGLNYCDFMDKHKIYSGEPRIEYELTDLEVY